LVVIHFPRRTLCWDDASSFLPVQHLCPFLFDFSSNMLSLHDDNESSPVNRNGESKPRSDTIDLQTDHTLSVDISDALSEKEKVKFTVHTKTTISAFSKQEFSVVRQHEEFIWLHTVLVENEEYSGFIIPPHPPRPDFDASREKLQKLGEGEGNMTREEFDKMKQELEAEYLATFKKTVAMHEVFLQRLASHPKFKYDSNFKIFLEYDQDLSVRGKNKKEKISGMLATISKSADDIVLSSTQKDVDEFFEKERVFLNEYYTNIKECTHRADRMTRAHKAVADSYIKISVALNQLSGVDSPQLDKVYSRITECFEKTRKIEGRVSSDEDLKLSDTFRYYMRETAAAKDLLYRRLRNLANYEAANRNLDKARGKNREVQTAEALQQDACEKFEDISKLAKQDLTDLKTRRVAMFKKNFVEFVELELKHTKAHVHLLKTCIAALKESQNS